MQWYKEQFVIDDTRDRIDLEEVHKYLLTTYWAKDRPKEIVQQAWSNSSLVIGLYDSEKLIGFARVITDFTIVAYLADVFLLEEYRGKGLGKWMVERIIAHPTLATVRWVLHTKDMHSLYRQVGFKEAGEMVMERPRVEPQ